jgi:uncharacterized protein YbaR (Trm112 family)
MVTYECNTCNAIIKLVVCPNCHGTILRRIKYTDIVRCKKCDNRFDLSERVCYFCHTNDWTYAPPSTYLQCRMCKHPLNEDKEPTCNDLGQIKCHLRGLWVQATGSCGLFYKQNIRNVPPKFLRR